uniref:MAK10-like protein n=1 Tax=Tanacetum cinerariifolium TaxID=118510 RepID=A0A6L2KP50_TANCI|nr:hypothetical protein [Tanacetum cinerariifolium]
MGDENPIRTLGDYSKPSHEGYMNTIELHLGNNVVPLRWLAQNGCSFYGLRSEDPNQHLKDFLKLVDSLDLDGENRTPKKLLIREEAKFLVTKNINYISLARGEGERSNKIDVATGDDIERPTETETGMQVKEVEKKNEAEKEEMTEGHVYEEILRKNITRKEDIGGNFEIPCNIGGPKHINALVDQGFDVNVMPISTYMKLTDERPTETDIRLSLASHSYIYPLGIVEDILVEVADHVYLMDFVILDIKVDEKRPFILGTPFLTTAKAVIKFDKSTITLRSGKSKISFHRIPESLCKIERGVKNAIDPIAPTMTVNRLVLEWEERIKHHLEREIKFDQWKGKNFKSKHHTLVKVEGKMGDEGEVTFLALGWHLEEIHMTWAHLEKKRTRLRTCTKIHQKVLLTKRGDGIAGIKRRRRDLSGDGVWILATSSQRSCLKVDLEPSTWQRRQEHKATMSLEAEAVVAALPTGVLDHAPVPNTESETPPPVPIMLRKDAYVLLLWASKPKRTKGPKPREETLPFSNWATINKNYPIPATQLAAIAAKLEVFETMKEDIAALKEGEQSRSESSRNGEEANEDVEEPLTTDLTNLESDLEETAQISLHAILGKPHPTTMKVHDVLVNELKLATQPLTPFGFQIVYDIYHLM